MNQLSKKELNTYPVRIRFAFLILCLFLSFVVVESLSCICLLVTPWTATHQASISFTISQGFLKLLGKSHGRRSLVGDSPQGRKESDMIERLHFTCPLSRWCHPTISSSVIPFSSCPQSFPASGSFQMSQFFTSGGQSIGVSASASVLPMNIQDWFHLG